MPDLFLDNQLSVLIREDSHIEDLIRADTGHFKWSPLFGSGAIRSYHGQKAQNIIQDLRIQCRALNIAVQQINYQNQQWNIQLIKPKTDKAF